jgi:hypothetical protein
MNALFHIASALAATLLLYGLLRMQRQRDLLRRLVRARGPKAAVVVDLPRRFVQSCAEATGVPFELDGGDGAEAPPARLDVAVLADLFLSRRPSLVRWSASTLELDLEAPDGEALTRAVSAALGGRVRVVLKGDRHARPHA